MELSKGSSLISVERARQINEEEWTAEHDDQHAKGELVDAAISYAAFSYAKNDPSVYRSWWPWEWKWWKPDNKRTVRNLVKAGALIAAEIDRLLRQENETGDAGEGTE